MELTSHHRSALLIELEKAQDDLDIARRVAKSEQAKDDLFLSEATDIQKFLAAERIELIKKSLIEDQIDY